MDATDQLPLRLFLLLEQYSAVRGLGNQAAVPPAVYQTFEQLSGDLYASIAMTMFLAMCSAAVCAIAACLVCWI